MTPTKRNEYLDADDSEGDGNLEYDSEAEKLVKGGRSAKRRRVDDEQSDEESDQDSRGGEESIENTLEEETQAPHGGEEDDTAEARPPPGTGLGAERGETNALPEMAKPLTKKNLVASDAAIKKSGVVYLSRIPPYMKPSKLRGLLQPYGSVNRLFLSPEDALAHARRVRGGGNKKRLFTEGWVEFVSRRDARRACDLLNARTIGGKKGGFYRDDLWNLTYLRGFKWHHLTEQIAAENAERSSRMRAEISKTARENKDFVRNVERARMLGGIESKKAAKRQRAGEEGGGDDDDGAGEVIKRPREGKSIFKQVPLAKQRKEKGDQPEQVQRVLSKIF